jgi:hypothetical protein
MRKIGAVKLTNTELTSATECTISYVLEKFIRSTCFGRHSIHCQEFSLKLTVTQ